jgi:hypothetical protein
VSTDILGLENVGPSGVRALPLAAGIKEGGTILGIFPLLLLVGVTTAIQICSRVSNFYMGS